MTLSDQDHALLESLAEDGRVGYQALASVTGWSQTSVHRRLTELRRRPAVRSKAFQSGLHHSGEAELLGSPEVPRQLAVGEREWPGLATATPTLTGDELARRPSTGPCGRPTDASRTRGDIGARPRVVRELCARDT
ncbi:AsnC family transcriptional regulator [Streptomyces sp. MspMP-M5]|uniref:AsnC family transcriptional regulator n=1 Tax=Streptomyces sp. MspMP-M5 TaxID=1155718 RepID=UPI003B63C252